MRSLWLLEIPQPKILSPRAVAMTGFEMIPLGHGAGLVIGERDSGPGVIGMEIVRIERVALHLELEQRTRTEQAVDFAHIALDHFPAGDVLKDDIGIREVELIFPF